MPAGDTLVAGTINANSGSSSAPAAGSVVSIASLAEGTVALQLTGTWVGTVIMEGIEAGGDPTAWLAAPTTTLAGVPATNLTANGIYLVNAAPFVIVRVRATAWTSGAATVTLHGALATTGGGGGGGGGGAVTVADGADTAEGATTDAAVQGDNAGTISAKLRGLNKSVAAGLPVTQQGTWNVTVNAALPTGANVIGGVTQSGTWTVQQGNTPTAVANAWPTKLTDGTNVAAVKAASTAAAATDPAAVVSFSPNSALPTGANVIGAVTQSGTWNVTVNAALPTGANVIGAVTQSGTWNVTVNAALPTGANTIGAVTGSGTFTTAGNKTNNNAAPGATNLGALPALANAAAQTWTEGNQVALSVDLSGNQRTIITSALPTGANVIGAVTQSGTWNVTVNAALPTGANVIGAVTQSGTWTVSGAVTPADSAANPTTTIAVDSFNSTWDPVAATWSRMISPPNDGSTAPTKGAILACSGFFNGTNQLTLQRNAANDLASTLIGAYGMYAYNNSSHDRIRNNVDVTLLASAPRSTTQTSADTITYNAHSLMLTLDMTNVAAGPSVTVTINYKDPASGKYILLLSGAAIITAVTNVYKINPNTPAVANSVAQVDLGRVLQFVVTHNNANSGTYSEGLTLIS
jgi:hypothetical protein